MAAKFTKVQLGAALWFLSIQYYILQIVVAHAWAKPYSLTQNTISDLANTHCGFYGQKLVCSPLHVTMNTSFLVLGSTMLIGAVLLRKHFTSSLISTAGFTAMALAGLGTLLVGLFPENTVSSMHILGAGLTFVFGNIGMLLLGLALRQQLPRWLQIYTMLSGLIGLVALVLFLTQAYLGVGIGGMERFTAYPQSIWMIVFGAYFLLLPRHSPTTVE